MTEKNDYAIQTIGLTKVFRDFWGRARVRAVDDLDLEVNRREVFGLLGPNGSGKSTTIKMLLGLLFPTRGAAKVLDFPPGHVKTNLRIGYLPEESHLYPFLNARETLDFYGRLFGIERAERKLRIESLIDMVGLTGAARRQIGEYSKGMMRRIGLAQALINDPDLLILDEPTSGLDPIGTRQIKDLIGELGRRGKTVLLCSHLLADVEDVCDRISILYGGKMQKLGSVDELLATGEQTQIRTDNLQPATLEKIKAAVMADHEGAEFSVETPRVRLEDFFLEIVENAQKMHQTAGAHMGSGLSDFLRSQGPAADSGDDVIAQLVEARDKPRVKAEAEEPVSPPVEQPNQEMLNELVEKPAAPVQPTKEDDSSSEQQKSEQPDQQVDRSVLDELLGKKTKSDNSDEQSS